MEQFKKTVKLTKYFTLKKNIINSPLLKLQLFNSEVKPNVTFNVLIIFIKCNCNFFNEMCKNE